MPERIGEIPRIGGLPPFPLFKDDFGPYYVGDSGVRVDIDDKKDPEQTESTFDFMVRKGFARLYR